MKPASITSAALLGTARMSEFPAPPHDALSAPWEKLQQLKDSSTALLQAAVLEKIATQAGLLPLTGVTTPEPCPDDEQTCTPPAAVHAVYRILDGEFSQNLQEWLTAAASANFIAPPRLLPALLDRGSREKTLRPFITAVAGKRGQWLAKEHKQWAWLLSQQLNETQPIPDDAWETGEPAERQAWFRQNRATDPAKAAVIIQKEWKSESPDSRDAITSLVAESPSSHDLPWLENLALTERRQSIRQSACRALIQLPESDYHQRAVKRAAQLLSIKRKGLKKTVTLTPPEDFDPAWENDGIKEKPPRGVGKKAWWSQQIIALIPLNLWPQLLGHDNPFKLPVDPEWVEPILLGWIDAARANPSPEHLTPLLKSALSQDKKTFPVFQKITLSLPELFTSFDAPRQLDLLEHLAQHIGTSEILHLLMRLKPTVRAKDHPLLQKMLSAWWKDKNSTINRPEATALASCIEPSAIPNFLLTISQLPDLSTAVEEFARTLEFRQTYLPHLAPITNNQ